MAKILYILFYKYFKSSIKCVEFTGYSDDSELFFYENDVLFVEFYLIDEFKLFFSNELLLSFGRNYNKLEILSAILVHTN